MHVPGLPADALEPGLVVTTTWSPGLTAPHAYMSKPPKLLITIGSSSPGRVMVAVQPPGAAPYPLTPPMALASSVQVAGSGTPAWQVSGATSGGVLGVGGGSRFPGVPVGGGGSAPPQRAGTRGFEPPVHHGSRSSRRYQLTISSVYAKPCTGQPR